ncbi:hypothetical protein PF003_g4141 [Phytophthora fragariae]|nr:hypothetical protein PF003_g4141 [Phytophthora fragariae]
MRAQRVHNIAFDGIARDAGTRGRDHSHSATTRKIREPVSEVVLARGRQQCGIAGSVPLHSQMATQETVRFTLDRRGRAHPGPSAGSVKVEPRLCAGCPWLWRSEPTMVELVRETHVAP